jgi:hypothetical protein
MKSELITTKYMKAPMDSANPGISEIRSTDFKKLEFWDETLNHLDMQEVWKMVPGGSREQFVGSEYFMG